MEKAKSESSPRRAHDTKVDAELADMFSTMDINSPKSQYKGKTEVPGTDAVLLRVKPLLPTERGSPSPGHKSNTPHVLGGSPKLQGDPSYITPPRHTQNSSKKLFSSPDPWAFTPASSCHGSPKSLRGDSPHLSGSLQYISSKSPVPQGPSHGSPRLHGASNNAGSPRVHRVYSGSPSPNLSYSGISSSPGSQSDSPRPGRSERWPQGASSSPDQPPRSMSVEFGATRVDEKPASKALPKSSRSLDYSDEKKSVMVTDLDQYMKQMAKKNPKALNNSQGSGTRDPKLSHPPGTVSIASLEAERETDLDAIEVESLVGSSLKEPHGRSPKSESHLKPPGKPGGFFRAPLASPETVLSSSPTSTPSIALEEAPPIVLAVGVKSSQSKSPPSASPSSKSSSSTSPARKTVPQQTSLSLDDVVRYPKAVPGKLDFRNLDVFEGKMLLQWLSSAFDDNHYLYHKLSRYDLKVVTTQFCTYLVAARVIKQLDDREGEGPLFKPNCLYYWTHTQAPSSTQVAEPGKLTPQWPPTQQDVEEARPGLKYTEAAHQTAMVGLRHEYKDEVDKLQREHKTTVEKIHQEYDKRLEFYTQRITVLQEEVEKYRILAGIEQLTKSALTDAEAANKEAGWSNGLNLTPNDRLISPCATPNASQYHTPAATPEVLGKGFANYQAQDDVAFNTMSTAELQSAFMDSPVPPPPPPPPVPGMVPPPPPPIPGVPPPPPPIPGGPPPPPPIPGGPPPPPPPPGVPPPPAAPVEKVPVKPVIKTISPMKPLFWKRIQVQQLKMPSPVIRADSKFLWEELEEPDFDVKEFDDLFSKIPVEKLKKTANKAPVAKKRKEVAKLIDAKRSQAVGILLSTLRMDMSEIENAILEFDTSALDTERLQAIFDARPEPDELKLIRNHVEKNSDIALDKPEQFLYDMSQIPNYADRIFCFIFHSTFPENVSAIDNKLNNLKMTCETLMSGSSVKNILGIILALGNYMNGGNGQRGQADGFGLDILAKLKDVKSKDNRVSLLQYVVTQYVSRFEKDDAGTDKVKLPIPDPSDIQQAALVKFDEVEAEIGKLKTNLEGCQRKSEKIITSSSEQYLEPFKSIMTTFFTKASQDITDQEENVQECKTLFNDLAVFYCVSPKSGEAEVSPEMFFSLWTCFTSDFKDLWKREQQKVVKQRFKEAQNKVKKIQEEKKSKITTKAKKAGGLKDRLAAKGKI